MPMTINGSGTITGLSAGGLPDATVTQADLVANVAGTGPCFSAWANAVTSITNTGLVPVQFGTKEFDVGGYYDTATGRFTPLVAGYYQLQAEVQYSSASFGVAITLLKNGAIFKYIANPGVAGVAVNGATVVYLNGSTDYAQIGGLSSTTQNTAIGQTVTHFSGFLARAA